jgi:thioredoxin-related protein
MKKAVLSLILVFPFLLFAQTESDGIKWAEGLTWNQIKEKAKEENKFIFVDAYATWCGPCKKMDKEVYTNKEVGTEVSQNFIAVKVQMDKTSKDDEQVKAWYPVAQSLNDYGIDGYPSFLFFSPDGKLAHKALGYQDTHQFVNLLKDALTDPELRYKKMVQQFEEGKINYATMPDLARQALRKKDKEFATSVAKKYKEGYIDKLNENEAYTKSNLLFLCEFYNLLSSKDRYFRFFRKSPELADSIIDIKEGRKFRKVASLVLTGIIRKEEITDKIYKDGKPMVSPTPDWNKIKKLISKKYDNEYVAQLFPDEQIQFYQSAKDWTNYVKYVNEKIKTVPPKKGGRLFGSFFGDAWQLNSYSWTLFLKCNDKGILAAALPWMDLSIQLDEKEYAIDTKANLLYKIGRVQEAIELEEKAAALSKGNMATLEKMKAGIPTWPQNK